MRRGSNGPLVKVLQAKLKLVGHQLAVDGEFGPQTEEAVRAFQQGRGLEVDGVVGKQTAEALEEAIGVTPVGPRERKEWLSGKAGGGEDWEAVLSGGKVLRKGDSGQLVMVLQGKLADAGLKCSVDGEFGPQTLAAVQELQQKAGLPIDGVVGPNTAQALDREVEWQRVIKGQTRLTLGSEGPAVIRLQQLLTAVGFGVARTGQFGPTTKGQVEAYQKARGIEVTGEVGPTTAKALDDEASGGALGPVVLIKGYEQGKPIGMVECVMVDGKPLERRTAVAFLRMRETAKRDGADLYVVSGMRTYKEQEELYNLYLQGKGNPAYPPGWSDHQNGIAVDIGGDIWWLPRHARDFGFVMPYSNEPWHWEYRP